jgi:hypothetical protein
MPTFAVWSIQTGGFIMGSKSARSALALCIGLGCATGMLARAARAQTSASWLNAASGDWIDPLNWSINPNFPNNGQPNLTDEYDAVISPIGGNYTVSLPAVDSITIHSLSITSPNATLFQQGATLSVVNGATIASGIYSLDQGTFAGGALRINSDMEWLSGGMLAGGTTTVAAGGVLNCTTTLFSSSPFRSLSRTLDNFGTVNLRAGSLTLSSGTLINEIGGVVNIDLLGQVGQTGIFSSGSALVSNLGQINLNGGSFSAPLVNSGTFTVNNAGSFTLFSATHNANSVLAGTGSIFIGGVQTLAGGVVTFAGGNINFGSFTNITGPGDLKLTGQMAWNNGSISGTGVMTVAPGATLTLGADGFTNTRTLLRRLNNSGVINIGSGGLNVVATSAALNNLAGGVINIAPGGSLTVTGVGSTIYSNQGTINLNTGSTNYILPAISNSGTIVANGGSIFFGTGTHLTGSTIAGPGTVYFGSNIGGTASHTFLGTSTLAGGNMILTGGSFSGSGDIILSGTLNWGGGSITTPFGAGTISASLTITPSGMLNLNPSSSFTTMSLARQTFNNGIVNLNSGSLSLSPGGTFTNQTGGVINIGPRTSIIGFSSTFLMNNLGTMHIMAGNSPAEGGGSFVINGGLFNAGTIFADSGSVVFSNAGGTTHLAGSTLAGVGSIDLGGGTHLLLGTATLAGKNMFMGSGSATNGPTFVGPGSVNLTGNLSWSAGSFGLTTLVPGVGSVNIASTGVLNIDTQRSFRSMARQADNFGVVNFNAGTVQLNNIVLNNHTGGVININTSPNFVGFGTGSLFNGGTVNLANGSIAIAVPFTNLGVLNVGAGASASVAAPFINGGTVNGLINTGIQSVTLKDGAAGGAFEGSSIVTVVADASANVQRIRETRLQIETGATLQLRPSGGPEGTSSVRQLHFNAPSSKLDLTDNHFVLDYSDGSISPVDSTRNSLRFGQIFSSLADTSHRIGYADNATSLHLTSFGGVNVDESSLLMQLTFAGDSNLDGSVDVTDLGALATHWQGNGNWTDGDFNYDGLIDVSDLGMLATNWQAGTGSFEQAMQAVGLGGVSVPEPTAVFAAAGVGLLGLRRRRPTW